MVLNNPKPYGISDGEEDDPWEMIGEETAPLATSQNAASVPYDARDGSENNVERESHRLETDAPSGAEDVGRFGSDSFLSAVSSITGDHRTVSDVEEGEDDVNDDDEGVNAWEPEEQKVPTGTLLDLPEKLLGHRDEESKAYYDDDLGRLVSPRDGPAEERPVPSAPPMVPNETEYPAAPAAATAAELPESGVDENNETSDVEESPSTTGTDTEADTQTEASTADTSEMTDEEKSERPDLVETLTNMGFEKEQIEKAIRDLREAGAAEIDEDSVIGEMMGEANDGGRTWDFVESTARGFEEQHELRRRTQNCVRNIGLSARELWSNVQDESQRFQDNLRATCDEADARARSARDWTARAATDVKHSAASAKDSACRANEKHGITEKVATAAVVGGAALLALGNPRAAVGAVAVAGATLAAGEAMKQSSARSGSTYTRDYGLGGGLHLD